MDFIEIFRRFLKAAEVQDYHAIVSALEEARGEDFSTFKIPADKVKPKVLPVRPRGYGGFPGSVQYSQEGYCDSNFFTIALQPSSASI
jgi:hypothetical protein